MYKYKIISQSLHWHNFNNTIEIVQVEKVIQKVYLRVDPLIPEVESLSPFRCSLEGCWKGAPADVC